MNADGCGPRDSRMRTAIGELQALIQKRHPEAGFSLGAGTDDPAGTYLTVTVDVPDTDTVVDSFVDRLVDFQVDDGLPLYVVVIRPLDRIVQESRASHDHRTPAMSAR